MSVSGSVLVALGSGLAKWLAKRYLGELSQDLSGELIDFGREKIPDLIERRNAARQFERYADDILKKLLESLESRRKPHPELDADAVCRELSETLNGRITEHFLIAKDLDPRVIAADLRQQRPLPAGRLPELETRVYEQVLDEIVRYVIEVASLLPRFETAVAAQSLKRLSNLGQDVSDVLNTVRQLEARVAESTSEGQEARWEADYRAAVIRHLDRVELFGADIPPEAQRNLLSEAFVSLNVERADEDTDERRESTDHRNVDDHAPNTRLLTCEELFDSLRGGSGRVIIRGSAGSGKTTLLRWAGINAARRNQSYVVSLVDWGLSRFKESPGLLVVAPGNHDRTAKVIGGYIPTNQEQGTRTTTGDELASRIASLYESLHRMHTVPIRHVDLKPQNILFRHDWRELIPFLVPLRHCQDGKLPTPEHLPLLIAKEVSRPPADWVRRILKAGNAIVMLDGVDEVPAQNRAFLKDEITAIVDAYPKCHFVLTSRPTAIPEDWLKDLGFQNADVSPMSLPDVERFVRRWHEATGKELARQGRPDANLAADAERLNEQFHQNPPLSLLATNPLLCAMICALHRARHHKLPESQYELCETLCHMLLHKRERESHLNWQDFPAAYIALSYEQKRGIAQQLAQWLVHNGQSAMPIEVAYEQVARALQRIPGRTPDEASLILKTFVERSGLLREPNPDVVDFLHNTFKELLAGDDLAGRGAAEAVELHVADESWRRVALFAVASPRSQTFASALVSRLLSSVGEPCSLGEPEGVSPRTGKKRGKVRGLTPSGSPTVSVDSDVEELKSRCRQDKDLLRTVLFVLQCRRVAEFLDEPLKVQADRLREVPFPPADFEAAEAIAQLGDDAVSPLNREWKLTSQQTAATIRALRLINTSASRDALLRFVDSEDWDAIAELAPAINPLTIPAVVDVIQSPGALPDSIRRHIRDVSRLAGLTTIEHLDLSGTCVADIRPLADLKNLEWLYLANTSVSDISALAGMTNLRLLDLTGNAVSNIQPLSNLKSLKRLFLVGTGVSDLSPLGNLTNLEWLSLHMTDVKDVRPLAGLTNLQVLNLTGTRITDISPLTNLRKLQDLDLNFTGTTELRPVAPLTGLHRLGLAGTGVTDVSSLVGLTNLQQLDLSATGITDVTPIAGLNNLKELNLARTGVTDVSALAGLMNLQRLVLADTKVTDFSTLRAIPRLSIEYGPGREAEPAAEGHTASRSEDQQNQILDSNAEQSTDECAFHINRVDVANWRGFERRTFVFAERVTVLIGNNGTGKSSTLEALAVGLAAWCGVLEPTAMRAIGADDVRRARVPTDSAPRVERRYPVSVRCSAKWGTETLDWLRTQESANDDAPPSDSVWAAAKKAERQVRDGREVRLPVMAHFPASRRWRDVPLETNETLPPGSPTDGYAHCLNPVPDVRSLKLFLKTRQWFVLKEGRAAPDLEAVQNAVLQCLRETEFAPDSPTASQRSPLAPREESRTSLDAERAVECEVEADGLSAPGLPLAEREGYFGAKVNRFEYDVSSDELVVGFDDGRQLPFGLLSDGQRTTIALVADIARRAATLNPHLGKEAAAKPPGIVLIDEIELHLHPRWQRTIVGDLRETFPLMQFVLTTHSPLIIQSCRAGEVINLDDPRQRTEHGRDFTEMSPEDILEYEQGYKDSPRSDRMLDMRAAAEQYYSALRAADSVSPEEREQLQRRLDELAEPFTNEPGFYAFLRLKRAAAGMED